MKKFIFSGCVLILASAIIAFLPRYSTWAITFAAVTLFGLFLWEMVFDRDLDLQSSGSFEKELGVLVPEKQIFVSDRFDLKEALAFRLEASQFKVSYWGTSGKNGEAVSKICLQTNDSDKDCEAVSECVYVDTGSIIIATAPFREEDFLSVDAKTVKEIGISVVKKVEGISAIKIDCVDGDGEYEVVKFMKDDIVKKIEICTRFAKH